MLSSSPFQVVGTHVQAMIFPPWSCETLSNICLFCDLISHFFSFLQGNYVFIFISKMHVYDAIMMLNKENSTVIFKATSSSQHKDLQRGSHGWSTISLVMGTNFWVLAGKYALAYFLDSGWHTFLNSSKPMNSTCTIMEEIRKKTDFNELTDKIMPLGPVRICIG